MKRETNYGQHGYYGGDYQPDGKKIPFKRGKLIAAGAIATVLTGLIAGGYFFLRSNGENIQIPATATPSAAAGTPTPEATPTLSPKPTVVPTPTRPSQLTPTPTPTPKPTEQPKPTEIKKAPNLGVRYDPSTGKCAVVERNTGKAVDTSNALFIERLSYQQTGVGVTKEISINLEPNQTAIIQGWKVDGEGDGVFKAVSATEKTLQFGVNIADGAVEVVESKNGPLIFCRAVQIAVEKGYAHQNIEIPNEWKVN